MNKRGQSEVWNLKVIAEIIFTMIIIVFLLYSSFEYNKHSNFNRIHLRNDLRINVNSLGASPGEIEMNYVLPTGYEIKLIDDDIEIEFKASLRNLMSDSKIVLTSKSNEDLVTIKEVKE